MQFLQPALLWGTLAIAIPIALHFWHQKKGKVIAWAATRFLFEKNQQSRRGLRLDQLLLLALRCLVVLTLVFLLSEPLFNSKSGAGTLQKIHLVQPDDFVVNNYRFELEKARRDGEEMYWLTPTTPAADELKVPLAERSAWNTVLLQKSLNQIAREGAELHLYIKNERLPNPLPFIQTPAKFRLHAVVDTLGKSIRNYRLVTDNQKLYVNASNRLATDSDDPAVTFAAQPIAEGTLRATIDLKNPLERKTAAAALRAFGEVYNLEIEVAEKENMARPSYVVVTETKPAAPQPATLYLVTNQAGMSAYPNVVYFPEKLTPQASSLVADGQLPKWLGEQLLDHWKIKGNPTPMSAAEWQTLFTPATRMAGNFSASTQQIIFILLLILVILERIVALTRNA
ncbi:BatA domain-containing protein [Persicitalea jodogahamensis]|uniref:Aerotolerance regulator N-terminal domain-containing protein n=1 Tax=Persicitalea jodogahamensis TaxID=402147 RepID=A0A8J3D3E9_9BACT|nr:BatA domain-containing protein [Persicitalea jodogahamensis]GHB54120.1 hypothetical protein GCM10007390_03830 [Persicitalea jodogahamensis]